MESNVQKMREALVEVYNTLEKFQPYTLHIKDINLMREFRGMVCHVKNVIDATLSTPLRNCDVGTAEEQSKRFMDFCRPGNRPPNCEECKVYPNRMNKFWCQLEWAQMPYEEGDTE